MLDIQYYQNKLNSRYKRESLQLIEFVGYKKPCKIKCLVCGNVYSFNKFSDAIKNSKKYCCHLCGKKEYLLQKFTQSLQDIFPNEPFEIIDFTNTQLPLKIKCKKCGNIMSFEVADSLKCRKHICRNCFPFRDEEIIRTRQNFLYYIESNNDWSLVQSLEGVHAVDLVKCECNHCGDINQKNMYDYMRGIKCHCQRRTNVRERIMDLLGDTYTIIEGGDTVESRVSLKHSCGFVYSVSCKSILSGFGLCPKCKRTHSKGERRIKRFLDKIGIDYEIEYPKNIEGHVLRFDFYIPSKNLYIEYQGKQHYVSVEYFGGEQTLMKQKKYDELKREFCKYHLLEISYKDFDNIEDILIHQFNDQG